MNNIELVSIIIVSYNSESFIEATLDSCLKQTYPNIEIIVTDDGSTDNTINTCHQWAIKNKAKLRLIESQDRKGIPANCNRGVKESQGEWLKLIAADDVLEYDAIENFINYAKKNNNDVVFSLFKPFCDREVFTTIYPLPFTRNILVHREKNRTLSKYYHWLFLLYFSNVAPAVFFKKSTLTDILGFDENYYLLEDLPTWYTIFSNNYSVGFLRKTTVNYRIHSQQVTTRKINPLLFKDLMLFNEKRKKFIFPYLYNKIILITYKNEKLFFLKYINIPHIIITLYNKINKNKFI
nr:putative glycosyltransferase EpsJ [Morganella morganii]